MAQKLYKSNGFHEMSRRTLGKGNNKFEIVRFQNCTDKPVGNQIVKVEKKKKRKKEKRKPEKSNNIKNMRKEDFH